MICPFTEQELDQAADEWGCNCGPSALAFALQLPLSTVRYAIPRFDNRRYTNPSMMKAGLDFFNQPFISIQPPKYQHGKPVDVETMFHANPSLVRVQWTGPWTAPGVNPKWAYWHTHWICTWEEGAVPLIFDCNAGITSISIWIDGVVPLLTGADTRADGEWFPTHIWRLKPGGGVA